MTPTSEAISGLLFTDGLHKVLRGELCVFVTPESINDSMLPTDHAELLDKGLYPLLDQYGADVIGSRLEHALAAICSDALGVFCAHQCFYIQIVNERAGRAPLAIDRAHLPRILGQAFLRHAPALHRLALREGDVQADRSYRLVMSGMRILAREDGIDWGVALP